jgi:restriction system protein
MKKKYFRVMLGKKSAYVKDCLSGNFIGVDFNIPQDLTGRLPDEWRMFNHEFIPVFLSNNPGKTKVAAGRACGNLWVMAKGIQQGDLVFSPDGKGHYHVADVRGDYTYQPGDILPHRRPVQWLNQTIDRTDMSGALKRSIGAASTVIQLKGYDDEIERLLAGISAPILVSMDETIEDPSAFAMEKHLEDFLVKNWKRTELAREYVIYSEDGEIAGQQFATDTGAIDILAISKDQQTLLVIELKKGRTSDVVVGQILRYMGFVKEELAEEGQTVKGVIIAMEDDQRIRRALAMVPDIDFYLYQISFKLKKV